MGKLGEMGKHRYYVYAIAAPDMRLPESVSGFGTSLHLLRYGELAAVVSRIAAAEVDSITSAANAENLVCHETVVEAVRRQGPALPVRFGTVLPHGEAVSRALAAHYVALRDDLLRVGDKIELGVSVLWQQADELSRAARSDVGVARQSNADTGGGAGHPGLAYLRARQTEYRRAESLRERAQVIARDLDVAIRPHALGCHRSICSSERLAVRDVYLLERGHVEAFENAVAEVRQRHQEVRFLVSGPWSPYNFVTPPARQNMVALQGGEQAAGTGH